MKSSICHYALYEMPTTELMLKIIILCRSVFLEEKSYIYRSFHIIYAPFQVVIKHLREQQARLEVEAEAASVLRIKQTRLEETLKSLNNDLKEAKKSHSPVRLILEPPHEKTNNVVSEPSCTSTDAG